MKPGKSRMQYLSNARGGRARGVVGPDAVGPAAPRMPLRRPVRRQGPPAIEVLDVLEREGRTIATVRVSRTGRVAVGMVLEALDGGARWRVQGLAFESPAAWEDGLRGLLLQPVEHGRALRKGERVVSRVA